jgi:hypothetical protein
MSRNKITVLFCGLFDEVLITSDYTESNGKGIMNRKGFERKQ